LSPLAARTRARIRRSYDLFRPKRLGAPAGVVPAPPTPPMPGQRFASPGYCGRPRNMPGAHGRSRWCAHAGQTCRPPARHEADGSHAWLSLMLRAHGRALVLAQAVQRRELKRLLLSLLACFLNMGALLALPSVHRAVGRVRTVKLRTKLPPA